MNGSAMRWLAAGLAGLAIGFFAGRASVSPSGEWERIAYLDAVQAGGVSAATLDLLDEGRLDALRSMHRIYYRGGLDRAYDLGDRVDSLEFPMPELVELAARAERYAQAHSEYQDLEATAGAVHQRLRRLSAQAAAP